MDHRLSYEGWIAIAEPLTKGDLSRLSRTSSQLLDMLRPLVYRQVKLSCSWMYTLCDLKDTLVFLQRNSDVAMHVEQFLVSLTDNTALPELAVNVRGAIMAMTRLKYLKVPGPLFANQEVQEQLEFVQSLRERSVAMECLDFGPDTLLASVEFRLDRLKGLNYLTRSPEPSLNTLLTASQATLTEMRLGIDVEIPDQQTNHSHLSLHFPSLRILRLQTWHFFVIDQHPAFKQFLITHLETLGRFEFRDGPDAQDLAFKSVEGCDTVVTELMETHPQRLRNLQSISLLPYCEKRANFSTLWLQRYMGNIGAFLDADDDSETSVADSDSEGGQKDVKSVSESNGWAVDDPGSGNLKVKWEDYEAPEDDSEDAGTDVSDSDSDSSPTSEQVNLADITYQLERILVKLSPDGFEMHPVSLPALTTLHVPFEGEPMAWCNLISPNLFLETLGNCSEFLGPSLEVLSGPLPAISGVTIDQFADILGQFSGVLKRVDISLKALGGCKEAAKEAAMVIAQHSTSIRVINAVMSPGSALSLKIARGSGFGVDETCAIEEEHMEKLERFSTNQPLECPCEPPSIFWGLSSV